MALTEVNRQDLKGVAAMLVGAFVVLALMPLDLTGPLGRGVGRYLWMYLGAGAVFVPAAALIYGLYCFERLKADLLSRLLILMAGLTVLLPYLIAVASGLRSANDLPAEYAGWTMLQKSVGIIAAPVTIALRSVIGSAGVVIVGIAGLSALTIQTFDWHPFRKLKPGPEKEALAFDDDGSEEQAEAPAPPEQVVRPEPPVREPDPEPEVREPLRKGSVDALILETDVPAIEAEDDELPPVDLLDEPDREEADRGEAELERLGDVLIETLRTFKVEGKVVARTTGPVVTQYEVKPAPGVKVGKIAALSDDLALAMRARSIRIVAPIPGKAAVGVEVPNPHPVMVTFRELIDAPEWNKTRAGLPVALGRDLEGRAIIADLSKMPHLLIAGATGAGKSVCINTIITSLIYRYSPRELRMLMIDPKMVELATYNSLPHLRHPVVTQNKQAAQILKWAVHEMERRYELFSVNTVRNLGEFNRKLGAGKELVLPSGDDEAEPVPYEDGPIPYIVIVVDELADLMMTVQAEVEKPLALLAQKARATGIHMILATQRPSVNVITGLIKANFPSRIAFRVASKVDSRTILDQNGAESLLGNGDMLFLPPGMSEAVRIQGAFISTEETESVTDWYRDRRAQRDEALAKRGARAADEDDILQVMDALEAQDTLDDRTGGDEDRDPLFREAAETCLQNQGGSTSLLQRKLRIGYGRAARIIDQLHDAGILGPSDGSKPREVLISGGQLDEYCS